MFTIGGGKPLEEKVRRRLLERQRVAAVPHGFRSSFRDWAAEETEHRREVIEAALAHVVENKVEAAYARSDLFERRRLLMDEWAAYLAGRVRQTDDDAGPCAPGRFGTIRCQSLNPATPRTESRRLPTSGWPCLSTGHRTLINPGITRGALSVWLLLPGSAIGPARTAVSDATALRPP